MIRAVLDTNTIVSGVGWGGPPGAVLDAALAGRFEIVTSPALLDELRRVLGYPKLRTVIGDVNELIELLALAAIVVTPAETGVHLPTQDEDFQSDQRGVADDEVLQPRLGVQHGRYQRLGAIVGHPPHRHFDRQEFPSTRMECHRRLRLAPS